MMFEGRTAHCCGGFFFFGGGIFDATECLVSRSRLWFLLSIPPRHVPPSLHVHVKVQHQQLGLLCAVAAAHRAHQLGVGGPDAPHHAAAAPALQRHQVPDEFARLQVPQLYGAVVRTGDDEVFVELEACHGALVLVGPCEQTERRSVRQKKPEAELEARKLKAH